MRKEAEAYYGLRVQEQVCANRKYVSMDLEGARLPPAAGLRRDDSPDAILPTEGAGLT